MAVQLREPEFNQLVAILSQHAEWQLPRSRVDLMTDVFAGSSRRRDILAQLDLDGTPRGSAVRVVQRLTDFGQDEPGREALGVLVNKLIAYLGGGDDAEFLRSMLASPDFQVPAVASHQVDGWRGRDSVASVTEKIIGENTLRDVCTLEILVELARGVCRIRGPHMLGTGFLVAEHLVMTNHHVLPSIADARASAFEFNYQIDRSGVALPVHTAHAAANGVFYTSPLAPQNATREALDVTVVEIENAPPSSAPLPLRVTPVRRDERVTIIQHPGGSFKKISLQNNFVEYCDDLVVQYTTSTEPGSSGAPVLSDDFKVVAVHHAGGQLTEPASRRQYLRNEGVRAAAVLDALEQQAPAVFAALTSKP